MVPAGVATTGPGRSAFRRRRPDRSCNAVWTARPTPLLSGATGGGGLDTRARRSGFLDAFREAQGKVRAAVEEGPDVGAACLRAIAPAVAVVVFTLASPAASAAPAFRVSGLSTHLERGVYYLDANLSLQLNQRARDALANGVALTFVVNIHIVHRRKLLWNSVVAQLRQRYRLSYRPLTERYRVKNLNSGAAEGYDSLAQALAAVSRIHDLPLVDASLLDPHTRYFVALRVLLDTKDLPGPLKLIAAIVPGWQLSSPWRDRVLTP